MNPPTLISKVSNRSGFTLIEMAVVLVIVGIIISIAATMLPTLIQSSKIKKTQAILEKVDYALQGYSLANHRLPFAASATDGVETSDTYTGYLPYRSLGLSSGDDVWGNVIKYGVYGESGGANNLTASFADASAFCVALNNASTAAFSTSITYTTTADPCSGASSADSSNQAYVLVSGGLKDLDSANGLFDSCNGESGAGFNIPGKIQTTTYDDLLRSVSINELNQKNCTGSGGGSGSSGGGEDTYTNGCSNGTDDDGDGYVDCSDQDCYGVGACGAGGTSVTITTTSIPSGPVNSAYSTTFQATGGVTPYEWTLNNNGGFTDFSIGTYTGVMSGTLTQCPGTYTVQVQVDDSTLVADGGPLTDTGSFSLLVTSNLTVVRTSGDGTATITWTTSTTQETFETSGGYLGTINWSLDDTTYFTVTSTGANTCKIEKKAGTGAGTYNVTLTGTDSSCAGNTAYMNLAITVQTTGSGTIGGITDTFEFDALDCYDPEIVHISGDIYAITYRGPSNDGYIKTVEIASNGQVTNTAVDTFVFNADYGADPKIVHVSGDIFAISYQGKNDDGFVATVDIDSTGLIANSTADTLEYNTTFGAEPDIIHISGNIYAIAHRGSNQDDGYLTTIEIATNGQITNSTVDTLEFDTSDGYEHDMIHISGNIYAIAYRGSNQDGFLTTVEIATNGQITNTVMDTLEFDTSDAYEPDIIPISGNIYAVAYRGASEDGYLKTIEIATDGQITNTVVDTLEYDTSKGATPDIINISGEVYAIAYAGPNGGTDDGFLKTVQIATDGQISGTVLDTLEFDGTQGNEPSIIHVSGNVFAIAYRGNGNDGYVKTVTVN